MPYDDLTGQSGFTSDSDGATLTVNVDMTEESARNLWDVQAAIQQIATDLQTAVRAAADFNSYLISMRETAQTIKMPSLGMEGGEGGNMSYSGGRVDSGSVPLVQSELGMANRIGEMEENASGAGGGMMAARGQGGRPFDPGEAVSQLTNIAWMAGAAGGHRQAPQETVSAYEQEYQFARNDPLHPEVQAARFGGQVGTPRAFAASRLIAQGLPGAQQFLSGRGGGGIAATLGRLGVYGAIGYAGYQLLDAGVDTYVQSRATGIATLNSGNGVGFGFEQRLGQAGMALSPYVTQEQAAQIYSTAVAQGWASRAGGFPQGDFSSAVNFMYGAAKDYGMDPAVAAQLLQTNSLGAGESVAALSEQLGTLKKTLDGTGISMDNATSSFTSFTSYLISSGVSPGEAAVVAGGTLKSFAGNTYLGQGAGADLVQAGISSPGVQAIVGGLTGNLPGAAFSGSNINTGLEAYQKLLHQLALEYSSQNGLSDPNKIAQFRTAYMAITQQNITMQQAEQIMKEAAADPNFITRGQDAYQQNSTLGPLEHQNSFQTIYHGLDSSITSVFSGLQGQQNDPSSINAHNYYNNKINTLLLNAGDQLGKYVLYGPDGQPVQTNGHATAGSEIANWFDNPEHYNQFNDPKGGYYIKGPDGNTYNAQNIGLGGSNVGVTGSGSTSNNTVYITLSDQAKQYFAVDKNQLQLPDGKN